MNQTSMYYQGCLKKKKKLSESKFSGSYILHVITIY